MSKNANTTTPTAGFADLITGTPSLDVASYHIILDTADGRKILHIDQFVEAYRSMVRIWPIIKPTFDARQAELTAAKVKAIQEAREAKAKALAEEKAKAKAEREAATKAKEEAKAKAKAEREAATKAKEEAKAKEAEAKAKEAAAKAEAAKAKTTPAPAPAPEPAPAKTKKTKK